MEKGGEEAEKLETSISLKMGAVKENISIS
jgi:hypothetical protein